MWVTRAANCSPEAALTVTVAGWPTLTEPMSDSLSETSILKRLTWASVMKSDEPDESDPEEPSPLPPSPPAMLAPSDALELLDELEDSDPELLPTVEPTSSLIAAIVPAIGARSVVAASAFSALVTASSALSTFASAAASEMVLPVPPPELESLPPESPLAEPLACDVDASLAALELDDESCDCTSSRVSWADCRFACASATSTFAALSSSLARMSSLLTWSPSST
jgi:hypothetical protein